MKIFFNFGTRGSVLPYSSTITKLFVGNVVVGGMLMLEFNTCISRESDVRKACSWKIMLGHPMNLKLTLPTKLFLLKEIFWMFSRRKNDSESWKLTRWMSNEAFLVFAVMRICLMM